MPPSPTPGSSDIVSSKFTMPTWSSPWEHSTLPISPQSVSRGRSFRGCTGSQLLQPDRLLASPDGSDRNTLPAAGGFYVQAFDGAVTLTVAGYDYDIDWTPMSAGLPPAATAANFAARSHRTERADLPHYALGHGRRACWCRATAGAGRDRSRAPGVRSGSPPDPAGCGPGGDFRSSPPMGFPYRPATMRHHVDLCAGARGRAHRGRGRARLMAPDGDGFRHHLQGWDVGGSGGRAGGRKGAPKKSSGRECA